MTIERADALVPAAQALPQTPSTRFVAAEIMDKRGFNPIVRMVELAEELEQKDLDHDAPVHAELRLKLYKELAKFYTPQPKSIDINVNSQQNYIVEVVDYSSLLEKRRSFLPAQARYEGPSLIGVTEDGDQVTD